MSNPVAIPPRERSGSASLSSARRPSSLSRSPVTATTIEYASTAPQASTAHAEDKDEDVPAHLYNKLPKQYLEKGKSGQDVPDYLRMILMCKSARGEARSADHLTRQLPLFTHSIQSKTLGRMGGGMGSLGNDGMS